MIRLSGISKEGVILLVLIPALFGLYSLDRTRLGHSVPDEKRYINSTKEMVKTGDYITPRYQGRLRFQKPILFYWLIVLSYKLWGVGVYGARFPSILAALLNVILVYLIGRDLFGKRTGVFSALVLSTSEVYFMYSRFSTPDMTFYLFIAASVYLFIKAYRGDIKGPFKYIYMYVPMALAMLTKGPLGIIYPMATACLFLALRREWPVMREMKILPGLLVFAAISGPWFAAMVILHGDAYIGNVWTMEIMKKVKYFSSGGGTNFIAYFFKSAFYYAGMTFVRHLPWSLFLPASLFSAQSFFFKRRKAEWGYGLITAWCLAIFAALVLIWSKESYYVLALSMPLSVILGKYFSDLAEKDGAVRDILFKLPFIAGAAVSFLAVLLWLVFITYAMEGPAVSPSLLMIAVPAFMAYAHSSKKRILLPASLFAASFAFFAYLAGYIMPLLGNDPLAEVAEEIRCVVRPEDHVGVASSEVSYNRLNALMEGHKAVRVVPRRITDWSQRKDLIIDFLTPEKGRVFCAITKDDYFGYVDEGLRNRLYVMDTFYVWKKFNHQCPEYYLELIDLIFKGRRALFRQALKEEAYLISNEI